MKGPMKLLDSSSGLMECSYCGYRHFANIRRGGKYYRGSWQCSSQECNERNKEKAEKKSKK